MVAVDDDRPEGLSTLEEALAELLAPDGDGSPDVAGSAPPMPSHLSIVVDKLRRAV